MLSLPPLMAAEESWCADEAIGIDGRKTASKIANKN
jgi:hypothetical protein